MDLFSLQGRIAVVTGAVGEYGTPFAHALAEAGATVVVTSREQSRADALTAELRSAGHRAHGLTLDQSEPASIARFAETVESEVGPVDVLVNNAVHREAGDLFTTTAESWDATAAVNARGLMLVTQGIASGMVARGRGSIVNISSIYGMVGPDLTLYEGTDVSLPLFYAYDKAGMIGFTRYAAATLGPYGVRVNCICPGGFNPTGADSEFTRAYAARTPLGRMAEGHDVSPAVLFLASDASRYVTGVTLPVDGGWTAK